MKECLWPVVCTGPTGDGGTKAGEALHPLEGEVTEEDVLNPADIFAHDAG